MTDPALFDRPDLAPLWTEARRRFEQGPVMTIRLRHLTPSHQRALADILGLSRLPGPDPTVSLQRLDAALNRIGLDCRRIVEAIGGPIVDRSRQRAEDREDRMALWQWLATHPVVAAQPALSGWVTAVRTAGLVEASVPKTRRLLERALAVLTALPTDGESLPAIADRVCDNPHALDDGTRLGTVVLRALAAQRGETVPTDAEDRRWLWESVGVACDALSTAVLVAGLRVNGPDPLATTLRTWAGVGQAVWITLAQIRTAATTPSTPGQVYVVENPSVVAAALARFGVRCPPLVCVHGWPNTAAILLLRRLREAGRTLYYHGDLDGEGVRITAYVTAKTSAIPWRMSERDYVEAVPDDGPPVGRVTDAPWDASLSEAMRSRGVALTEERVIRHLLDDIAPPT